MKDNVRKTIDVFADIAVKDPEFVFRVQPDEGWRIKNLMWATGSRRNQYIYFGDVITHDTTYSTNLYDMPFGSFVGGKQPFKEHYTCRSVAS